MSFGVGGWGTPSRMTQSSKSTMEAHSHSCLWFALHNVIILLKFTVTNTTAGPLTLTARLLVVSPSRIMLMSSITDKTRVPEEANFNREAGLDWITNEAPCFL